MIYLLNVFVQDSFPRPFHRCHFALKGPNSRFSLGFSCFFTIQPFRVGDFGLTLNFGWACISSWRARSVHKSVRYTHDQHVLEGPFHAYAQLVLKGLRSVHPLEPDAYAQCKLYFLTPKFPSRRDFRMLKLWKSDDRNSHTWAPQGWPNGAVWMPLSLSC
jgi:hypothetical protein